MQPPKPQRLVAIAALVLFCSVSGAEATAPIRRHSLYDAFRAKGFDDFVAAIHQHESDSRVGRIFGDGGRSYGPLQISYKAWRDAFRYDRTLGGKYADCSSLEYSKRIMWAYLQYHDSRAVNAGDWETCARLWNSGPAWRSKLHKTNEYWASVRHYLGRQNS